LVVADSVVEAAIAAYRSSQITIVTAGGERRIGRVGHVTEGSESGGEQAQENQGRGWRKKKIRKGNKKKKKENTFLT
jgi:hypothetical protein